MSIFGSFTMFIFFFLFDESTRVASTFSVICFNVSQITYAVYCGAFSILMPTMNEISAGLLKSFHDNLKLDDLNFVKTLKMYSKVFMRLSELCQSVSFYFCITNLFILFNSFIFLSYESYCVFVIMKDYRSYKSLILLAFTTTWLLVLLTCLIVLMYFSCCINHHAMSILNSITITNHPCSQLSSKKFKQISIFALQVSHRQPKMTCAIFHLNMNFLFNFCTHVMSISIMFIQFYGFNK